MELLTSRKLDNPIDLAVIHPNHGKKYSPNLYDFLRAKARHNKDVLSRSRVYRDVEGTLWLGYMFDGEFIGTRLSRVLVDGAQAEIYSYGSSGLTELQNFWQQYQAIGRCAIDPEHRMGFIGDDARWNVHGDHRSCQWCGNATQKLERYTVTEQRQRWVTTSQT
jgi:hypothetical protein